jgi:hypothetical protein
MATALAVPAEAMRGRRSLGDDRLDDDHDLPDRGPAQEVIGEMAGLLRDTRGSMLLGGRVLAAITVGIGVEAAFSSVLRPGVAGIACMIMLGVLIGCWFRAGVLLLLAGRPVLDQLNEHRWRTGAPVDPRVRWLTLPAIEEHKDAWNTRDLGVCQLPLDGSSLEPVLAGRHVKPFDGDVDTHRTGSAR